MFKWSWPSRVGQRDASRNAYIRSYDASPDFIFPEKFDLSDNGLLLTESIRTGSGITVLLYWTSEERMHALEPAVLKILGICNPSTLGHLVQIRMPAMPKWTENPGKWLLTAAALFGAMSVVRDNFTDLFAAPDVVIFTGNTAASNFHTGDPIDLPLVVRNEAQLGHADIHLKSAQLTPDNGGGAVKLGFDISELPGLQAGQQIPDVHIRGLAPGIRTPQPQIFSLTVDADTKEGFFRRTRKAAIRTFTVKVWPDHGYGIQVNKTSDSIARVHIDLWPGLASTSGLHGQFVFNSVVPLENDGIVPLSGTVLEGSPILAGSSSKTLGKVSLQTGTLQAFHGYPYEVSLVFQRPLTKEEWDYLRSSIKVAFE
jgi:hypothetical protein